MKINVTIIKDGMRLCIITFEKTLMRIYVHKISSDLCDHMTNKFKVYTHPKDLRGFRRENKMETY